MNRDTITLLAMLALVTMILTAVVILLIHSMAFTPTLDVDTTVKVVGSIQ